MQLVSVQLVSQCGVSQSVVSQCAVSVVEMSELTVMPHELTHHVCALMTSNPLLLMRVNLCAAVDIFCPEQSSFS